VQTEKYSPDLSEKPSSQAAVPLLVHPTVTTDETLQAGTRLSYTQQLSKKPFMKFSMLTQWLKDSDEQHVESNAQPNLSATKSSQLAPPSEEIVHSNAQPNFSATNSNQLAPPRAPTNLSATNSSQLAPPNEEVVHSNAQPNLSAANSSQLEPPSEEVVHSDAQPNLSATKPSQLALPSEEVLHSNAPRKLSTTNSSPKMSSTFSILQPQRSVELPFYKPRFRCMCPLNYNQALCWWPHLLLVSLAVQFQVLP